MPTDLTDLNPSIINGLNSYCYTNNNPIRDIYSTVIGKTNTTLNLQFSKPRSFFNQTSLNYSTFAIPSLHFCIGLVTPDNPKLPDWMDFSAFYIRGYLGFGVQIGKFSSENLSWGLPVVSLNLGTVSMKCDIVTFNEDTSLYLGIGAINANATLELMSVGSLSAEIISFYFGVKFSNNISLEVKFYFGLGASLDFYKGIKIGIAEGFGLEISLNF